MKDSPGTPKAHQRRGASAAASSRAPNRKVETPHPSPEEETPAALGFRFPAEWERHEATWIGWPHHTADWPGKFAAIPWVFGEIVRHLVKGEKVRVLVQSAAHEKRARDILDRVGAGGDVEFFRIPTDRAWTRDSGPLFLKRDHELAIAGFHFNGWAKYRNCRLDAAVARDVSGVLGHRFFPVAVNGKKFVLEGGAIDGNGRGTLVTTEECLLDQHMQPRNPGLRREEIERVVADYLGASNVLWLGRGIAGDDTHGHVDDVCRFVNPRTLVLCRESNQRDPNYGVLAENWERVQGMHLEDGSKVEVAPLPMPAPVYFDGQRLPASYANFYIANAAVLVPTFNDPNDRIALGALAELITDRPVLGIHSLDLVWGLGTLHCLTQQQPQP
ncbi:MAG TPA: agmatine deiminase family protein [Terriglobia bacterium]|nr:agmatine deiminase family protein [Terriglobia bacterium]